MCWTWAPLDISVGNINHYSNGPYTYTKTICEGNGILKRSVTCARGQEAFRGAVRAGRGRTSTRLHNWTIHLHVQNLWSFDKINEHLCARRKHFGARFVLDVGAERGAEARAIHRLYTYKWRTCVVNRVAPQSIKMCARVCERVCKRVFERVCEKICLTWRTVRRHFGARFALDLGASRHFCGQHKSLLKWTIHVHENNL